MHAEPITFGLKLALWYDEMKRDLARLSAAAEDLRVGKISGPSEPSATLDPRPKKNLHAPGIEAGRHCLAGDRARPPCRVDLGTRHLNRDARKDRARNPPLAALRSARSGRAVQCRAKRFLRHAPQTQPVTCEQISGLARVVRGNLNPAIEDIALWHERDISHSSVERVILADSAILTDYLLAKTIWLIDGMRVYPSACATISKALTASFFPDSSYWIWRRQVCCESRLIA